MNYQEYCTKFQSFSSDLCDKHNLIMQKNKVMMDLRMETGKKPEYRTITQQQIELELQIFEQEWHNPNHGHKEKSYYNLQSAVNQLKKEIPLELYEYCYHLLQFAIQDKQITHPYIKEIIEKMMYGKERKFSNAKYVEKQLG